jgi:hypothetical protein
MVHFEEAPEQSPDLGRRLENPSNFNGPDDPRVRFEKKSEVTDPVWFAPHRKSEY